MTHYHFFGAAAVSAALIAFLNSPAAQRDAIQYLGFMEHGIYTAVANLRNAAESMAGHNQPSMVYPPNVPLPASIKINTADTNGTNGTNSTDQK
ncbi:MAG: hypothetical protein QXV17_05515 [Candidatus Micrarchaeaceae archaeon]